MLSSVSPSFRLGWQLHFLDKGYYLPRQPSLDLIEEQVYEERITIGLSSLLSPLHTAVYQQAQRRSTATSSFYH